MRIKRLFLKREYKVKKYAYSCLFCMVMLLIFCSCTHENPMDGIVLNRETEWNYLDDYSEISKISNNNKKWTDPNSTDDNWKQGSGSFGAKKGKQEAVGTSGIPDVLLNQYIEEGVSQPTYFFRTTFQLERLDEVKALRAKVEYDDAIIIYINGNIVFEGNVPQDGYADYVTYGAKQGIDQPNKEEFIITDTALLKKGDNLIEVELHQVNEQSSDIFFLLEELKTLTEVPTEEIKAEEIKTEEVKTEIKENISMQDTLALTEMWISQGEKQESRNIQLVSEEQELLKVHYQEKGNPATAKEVLFETEYRNGIKKCYYEAELTNLLSDTIYEYYIANGKEKTQTYEMEMPVKKEQFNFFFLGDPQFREKKVEEDYTTFCNMLQIGETKWGKPNLLLMAGDIADDGEAVKGYQRFVEVDAFKEIPMITIKGNHDKGFFEEYFAKNMEEGLGDRMYDLGDALLVTFDSNQENFEEKEAFLHKAIELYPKKWIIVTMHHSIFSVGEHYDSNTLKNYRKIYSEMFSKENVDLVLMGHDHTYTRTWPMQGETVIKSQLEDSWQKSNQQVLYITVNSSTGSKYYDVQDTPEYVAVYNQDNMPSITKVEIGTKQLRVTTCNGTTMEQVDDITIKK